jgi:outer membrane protein assembly factor BamB
MLGVMAVSLCVTATLPGASARATTSSTAPCRAVARHQDPAHSGFSCTTLPTILTKKWSVTLNGAASYPIIADGKVYMTTSNAGGTYGGWLYALDAADGTVAWGPVPLSGTYYYFPLAYDAGRVFVNDFDGTVRAFDGSTGAQLWVRETSYFSGEPVARNGVVWLQGAGVAFGLSQTSGQIVAQSSYLDGDGAAPAADSSGVYLSTGCESQYRLAFDGSIVWVVNNGCSGGGGSSTALWKRFMYGSDGDMVLRKDNGAEVSTFAGTPAFSGLVGYFGFDDSIYAEDVKTHAPLWTTPLNGTFLAGPVATSTAVYVATSKPSVVVLDPVTGGVLSSVRLPGQPGGGGQYFADPSDMAAGESLLVVPTGAIVSAFG